MAKEAIALDSNFAGAWGLLYVSYSNMNSVTLAAAAARRAYELKDRLPEFERLRIEARYHSIRGDAIAEEAAWARLVALGRDENSYANMLLGMRRLPEAEAMARRAVTSDPRNSIAYWNLAEAQTGQQRFEAAESTAVMIAERMPENPYRWYIPLAIRWTRRDLDAVEAFLPTLQGAVVSYARSNHCLVDLFRGRIRAWQACAKTEQMFLIYQNPMVSMAEFRMTGDTARARDGYETFLATTRDERNLDRYAATIALLADVGRIREAGSLLDERSRAGPSDPGYRADSAQAVGAIAAARGEWDRAVSAFLAWNSSPAASGLHLYNRGLPEAAAILARNGRADSAIVLLERALAMPALYGGNIYEAGWYAQALLMLGELYEARGDRAKAAEYYRRHIDVFKEPDPPIARQVTVVREKLARVTGEPGGASKR
jgi:tetratricopeptide (TPR) repeat protein